METLESLGLAANILQFCQAVGSFINQAHEIYRSGPAALGKVNDLRGISKDLHKMLSEMPENPGKRESIMIAFRARWNRSKLEDLEKQIESFRQQLVLDDLVTIRCVPTLSLSARSLWE
ncbi:hypothetical protein QC763_406095 [Podospora pseudopauciseta]|uniref:NACHT-NTPase and P-loop NTPases N-terminal domain-containing protein n=1 Tax=Podospora pseudopauciseta TaxID=2093780 RepID=A0ABR0HDP2_9PEZI|nr:hypothetical protein QC763_406095 [Podospora pseudopauciseta]